MISKGHPKLSISAQCRLLSVCRSGLYYEPAGECELNEELMRLMDEHYMKYPFKGARRMHTWLTMDKGYDISMNRIERLYYHVMGLRAVMPGPHTSKRRKDHAVFPYLLRGLEIVEPNQAQGVDITYIPMRKGFMYLLAFIDLYSRFVPYWSLSNCMDGIWAADSLKENIQVNGRPQIINTDQGSQFTSNEFTGAVLSNNIRLSMDGKGRAIDNVFIERLWRSVKYECIYLNPPENGGDLYKQLEEYFHFYNYERRHQGIDNGIPAELYYGQNDPKNTGFTTFQHYTEKTFESFFLY